MVHALFVVVSHEERQNMNATQSSSTTQNR